MRNIVFNPESSLRIKVYGRVQHRQIALRDPVIKQAILKPQASSLATSLYSLFHLQRKVVHRTRITFIYKEIYNCIEQGFPFYFGSLLIFHFSFCILFLRTMNLIGNVPPQPKL